MAIPIINNKRAQKGGKGSKHQRGLIQKEHKKPRVVEVDYVPEEEAQKVSSFEILQKKEWILDWDCVKFRQGYFVVLPPSDGTHANGIC
ncbi:MAG: hypothetical protein IKH43_00510 [Bacteroidaceae bacterium]|nr:hypothetical protein [Bacteroidaceae bacterium]